MQDFTDAIAEIRAARSILLTTHVRPDGDAVGSVVALDHVIQAAATLENRPCTTQLLFLSQVPQQYRFMLPRSPWVMGEDIAAQEIASGRLDDFDLIIVADTGAERQLVGISDYLKQRDCGVLVFDHHLTHDGIGTLRVVDTQAGATGQIVFQLCRAANWCLDEPAAAGLFVAISSDTGWFRFQNASASVLSTAGELITAGAQPDRLYRQLYQNFPPQRLHLRSLALQSLELHCDGRLALMQITNAMLTQTGADRSHIENIVNEPMEIGSLEAVVLVVEQDDGGTRCSLRSRELVDVDAVARPFGGGGHARAAGLTLELPLSQTREKILNAMTQALQNC